MKVTWEAKDIESGVRYSRHGIGEVWMIIREPGQALGVPTNFLSVSLKDGFCGSVPKTADAKAHDLTEGEYLPMFVMDGLGIEP